MRDIDEFRAWLAERLRFCAQQRRELARSARRGGEVQAASLLEKLARDVPNLDPHVYAIYQTMVASDHLTNAYRAIEYDLFARIGVSYAPSSATALLRWMIWNVAKAAEEALVAPADAPGSACLKPARLRAIRAETARSVAGWPDLVHHRARAWLTDVVAGLGVLAPVASVWKAVSGMHAMDDLSYAATHPWQPATVVSVDRVDNGKAGVFEQLVLTFPSPDGGAPCRVSIAKDFGYDALHAGETVQVVPKGSACGQPLIPSEIADPRAAMGLSLGLLLTGVLCLRLWTHLRNRPGWTSAEGLLSRFGNSRPRAVADLRHERSKARR